jgi:hypothetical protein
MMIEASAFSSSKNNETKPTDSELKRGALYDRKLMDKKV